MFSGEKKKNGHKRSLSFGSKNDEKKSLNNKLINELINEVEITDKKRR